MAAAITINAYTEFARGVWYPSTAGAFYNANTKARYAVGIQRALGAGQKLRVAKSPDGVNWTLQDDTHSPIASALAAASNGSGQRNFSVVQSGTVLYVAYPDVNGNVAISVFDTATNAWGATISGGPAVNLGQGDSPDIDNGGSLNLIRRANGNLVVLYQALTQYIPDTTTTTTITANPATSVLTQTPIVFTANNALISFTSTGTLPGGLSAGVWYYIINQTGSTFQVSTTLAGPPVSLSSAGTGTITGYAAGNVLPVSYVEWNGASWSAAAVAAQRAVIGDPNYAPNGIVLGDNGRLHFFLSRISGNPGNYINGAAHISLDTSGTLGTLQILTTAAGGTQEPRVGQAIGRTQNGSTELLIPWVGANGSATASCSVARAISAANPTWSTETIAANGAGAWGGSFLNCAVTDDGTQTYAVWQGRDAVSGNDKLVYSTSTGPGAGWSAPSLLLTATPDENYETPTTRAMGTGFLGIVFTYFNYAPRPIVQETHYLELGTAPSPAASNPPQSAGGTPPRPSFVMTPIGPVPLAGNFPSSAPRVSRPTPRRRAASFCFDPATGLPYANGEPCE